MFYTHGPRVRQVTPKMGAGPLARFVQSLGSVEEAVALPQPDEAPRRASTARAVILVVFTTVLFLVAGIGALNALGLQAVGGCGGG